MQTKTDFSNIFKELKKSEKRAKDFESLLYSQDSRLWAHPIKANEESRSSIAQTKTKTEAHSIPEEKAKALQSLRQFAQKVVTASESEEKSYHFDGGKIKIVDSISDYHLRELQSESPPQCFRYSEQNSYKVAFFGEKEELFPDPMLSKMAAAMGLAENQFVRAACPDSLSEDDAQELLDALCRDLFKLKISCLITLGARPTHLLMQKKEKLQNLRGRFYRFTIIDSHNEKKNEHTLDMMPIFHPEFLRINPNMKKTAWNDLQSVMKRLNL